MAIWPKPLRTIGLPKQQHHYFAKWVKLHEKRFDRLLGEKERLVGEWLVQAHSTRYQLPHEPFVAFDLMKGQTRLNRGGGRYHDFLLRVLPLDFVVPRLIHMGQPVGINWVVKHLTVSGHGAIDEVEGAVWRVERKGKPAAAAVDFLVKFVKPYKQDGIYLPEISGKEAIWNIDVSELQTYPS